MQELRKGFHQDMRDLEEVLVATGRGVEQSLTQTAIAFRNHDTILALRITGDDLSTLHGQCRFIEEQCVMLLATQAPVAGDLSRVLTMQLVALRFDDMASHLVALLTQLMRLPPPTPRHLVEQSVALAQGLRAVLHESLQALLHHNRDELGPISARALTMVRRCEQLTDEVSRSLQHEPLEASRAGPLLLFATGLIVAGESIQHIVEHIISPIPPAPHISADTPLILSTSELYRV